MAGLGLVPAVSCAAPLPVLSRAGIFALCAALRSRTDAQRWGGYTNENLKDAHSWSGMSRYDRTVLYTLGLQKETW